MDRHVRLGQLSNKYAKLHWFGNVRKNKYNSWRIRCGFEEKNRALLTVDVPIASLPYLRIGEWYYDGTAMPTNKEGIVGKVYMPESVTLKPAQAINVCKRMGYYLHGHRELMTQKMFSFESNGMNYHVPQIELIRALFALHKPLCNAMLRPNGFAFLVEDWVQSDRQLKIYFSGEIKKSSLNDDFVHHIAWLLLNEDFIDSYHSIFSSVMVDIDSVTGAPITVVPPKLDHLELTYRGWKSGKEVLIFEILGLDGFELDLDVIYYTHPLLKTTEYNPGKKKGRVTRRGVGVYDVRDQTPHVDAREPVVPHETTKLGFTNRVEVKGITNSHQAVHQGNVIVEKQGHGGVNLPAGVDESVYGGGVKPIDIQVLEVTEQDQNQGLDEFLEMMQRLGQGDPTLTVDTTIYDLPKGRKFSQLPNGNRRRCAVAKIQRLNRITFVLEVSRPDGHSLSSLVLYPLIENSQTLYEKIESILRDLVYNQGHWQVGRIKSFRYQKLRHTYQNEEDWIRKIVQNLA